MSEVWIFTSSVLPALRRCGLVRLESHLGDDVAAGLGVRFAAVRAVVLLCAVLLAGVAVSAAGPVPFVALVAPQVAMRLTRCPTPPLAASAVTGALLLLGSDLVARTALPVGLPVGVVTAAIGGPFLVHLLVRANLRKDGTA